MSVFTLLADAFRLLSGKKIRRFTTALVVAAGNSTRMGGGVSKQFMEIGGVPVLARTLLAFEKAPLIKEIVVVAKEDSLREVRDLAHTYGITKLTAVVAGGDTRALSVKNGMAALSPKAKFVAIHDGARCLVTPPMIEDVCRAAYTYKAATAAAPVTDTVKLATKDGFIKETLNRNTVFLATTPQVFSVNLYQGALATVTDFESLTDDNQLIERLPHPVKIVDCGKTNLKITTPEDIGLAEAVLRERGDTL